MPRVLFLESWEFLNRVLRREEFETESYPWCPGSFEIGPTFEIPGILESSAAGENL